MSERRLRDESALVAELRKGDELAFTHLVRTHGPRMYATAQLLLRDSEAARDALQLAFLSVHRSISGFEARRGSIGSSSTRRCCRRARQPDSARSHSMTRC